MADIMRLNAAISRCKFARAAMRSRPGIGFVAKRLAAGTKETAQRPGNSNLNKAFALCRGMPSLS